MGVLVNDSRLSMLLGSRFQFLPVLVQPSGRGADEHSTIGPALPWWFHSGPTVNGPRFMPGPFSVAIFIFSRRALLSIWIGQSGPRTCLPRDSAVTGPRGERPSAARTGFPFLACYFRDTCLPAHQRSRLLPIPQLSGGFLFAPEVFARRDGLRF